MLNTFFSGEEAWVQKRKRHWEEEQRQEKPASGMGSSPLDISRGAKGLDAQIVLDILSKMPSKAAAERLFTIQRCHALSGTWRRGESPPSTVWLLFLQGEARVCRAS